jgi:hypothetical protein
LRPLYLRAIEVFGQGDMGARLDAWVETERPLLISSFHHLILGHFAFAQVTEALLGGDLHSQEGFERHVRFLRKLFRLLINGPRSAGNGLPSSA